MSKTGENFGAGLIILIIVLGLAILYLAVLGFIVSNALLILHAYWSSTVPALGVHNSAILALPFVFFLGLRSNYSKKK
jgi:cytochrome b subunit of formate dehydrogenase